jgi:tRNA threonylcarbamoyladenosine biosynthesis protein TsaE
MHLHVIHFAVKSVVQPCAQAWFRIREVDAGHTDAGESKLMCPGLDAGHQTRTVDLTAADRHPPIVKTAARHLRWAGEEDTHKYAAELARRPAIGDAFIELHGDLGAGKTTFVRHLLRALGVREHIKSPTYTLMEPHEAGGIAIYHFDFYRMGDAREWEDAGFRDVFAGPGLKIAEWPEKAAALLPLADLAVTIEAQPDDSRTVTLRAQTPRGEELLN